MTISVLITLYSIIKLETFISGYDIKHLRFVAEKKKPKADLFDIKCKQVFEKWKYHMRNEKSEH